MGSLRSTVSFLLFLGVVASAYSQSDGTVFRYLHREGEAYRIVGVDQRETFVDGRSVGAVERLTRIQIEIGNVDTQAERPWATIQARYQVSEESRTSDEPFSLSQEYDTRFQRTINGEVRVPADAFMPQVRNIPLFPPDPVSVGDRWTAPATEVYDFRESFDISDPVRIPIQVEYEYLGREKLDNRGNGPGVSTDSEIEYHVFAIRYSLFFRPPQGGRLAEELRLMTAQFSQRMYWDNVAGRPHFYQETYNMFFQRADGARFELRGSADGRVVGAPPLNRESVQAAVEERIAQNQIPDANVRTDERGVTISLENIQFQPDSAVLMPSEREKLSHIGQILSEYPERDLLITGHTALAGTEDGRRRLSEERAASVGEFLIESGVRNRDQIVYRGLGAREPIASNDTAEGRSRNRRVEITILEN